VYRFPARCYPLDIVMFLGSHRQCQSMAGESETPRTFHSTPCTFPGTDCLAALNSLHPVKWEGNGVSIFSVINRHWKPSSVYEGTFVSIMFLFSPVSDIPRPEGSWVHVPHCFLRVHRDCAMGWFDRLQNPKEFPYPPGNEVIYRDTSNILSESQVSFVLSFRCFGFSGTGLSTSVWYSRRRSRRSYLILLEWTRAWECTHSSKNLFKYFY